LPVIQAGLVDQSEPGMELFPGLTFELAPGHTPDQLAIRLRSEGGEALFTADAVHTPIQVVRPEWSSRYCLGSERRANYSRENSRRCRREGNGTFSKPLLFAVCGRIVKDGSEFGLVDLNGRRW